MPQSNSQSVELLGEAAAYRSAYLFLLKALEASLAGMREPARTLAVEAIESQLAARRGELIAAAPRELEPALQTIFNRAMQRTLQELSEEVSSRLRTPPT